MDFELTEEQRLIQQTARDFAQREIAPKPTPAPPKFDLSYGDLQPPAPPPPPPPAPAPMIHMSSAPPTPHSSAHRPAEPAAPPPSYVSGPIPSAEIPGVKKGIPAWLFWTFLVISFCFAGGVAAALLTHFLQ